MNSEQKAGKSEKEAHDSLDNFIKQAIGKESFQPFSTASDYQRKWIQSFQALDEQGINKLSKGPKVDRTHRKDWPLEYCNGVSSLESELNGIKESISSLRESRVSVKGTKNSSDNMHSLKIPEAVVAFAQAAAKTNDLHGWPLLSPTPMQKCDKCSREFCSPINHRRHIRVHRRSLNIDKDSVKNRGFLAAFWDKLSLDEAKEIVSFKDVALEDVAGSSIIKALTSFIRKLGFSSLPHAYVKAGAALLDVVQAKPPRFPITSQEFFSILDDASEKTFLCAGTAVSMQKFVFDGEAGKIGLEMKNLIACTSFLVEQRLVKAWIADKDAEALRCQKLLVEEEEAAQRRQAELLERKRLKKLRQKEQRVKDQIEEKADSNEASDTADVFSPEKSNLPTEPASSSKHETSDPPLICPLEPVLVDAVKEAGVCNLKLADTDSDMDIASGSADALTSQNVDAQALMQPKEGPRKLAVGRRSPKLIRNAPNGFHSVQIPLLKPVTVQKHNPRDQRAASSTNAHKVWTRKIKVEDGEDKSSVRGLLESGEQPDKSNCSEVLIGSISIMLGEHDNTIQDNLSTAAIDPSAAHFHKTVKSSSQVKYVKQDAAPNGTERSTVKLWRPVGRHENYGGSTANSDKREDRDDGVLCNAVDTSGHTCMVLSSFSDDFSGGCKDSPLLSTAEASSDLQIFSSCVSTVKDFLYQRWKGALAAGLVLSSQNVSPDCDKTADGRTAAVAVSPALQDGSACSTNGAGNLVARMDSAKPVTTAAESNTTKFRTKTEKGSRLKYVPKQRTIP